MAEMDGKEAIRAYFQEMNINVGDAVLQKCIELCKTYCMDAEYFCDEWYAYTSSNLKGADPTVEHLEKLERKEFIKNREQSFSKVRHEEEQRRNTSDFENAVLTPQSKKKENPTLTPVSKTPISKQLTEERSIKSSEKFLRRNDSRSVQCYHGSTKAKFKREDNIVLSFKEVEEHKIPPNLRYMYQVMGNQSCSINNVTYDLGHDILAHNGLRLSEGLLSEQMGDVVTYGRIVSDNDGEINAQSILLEGSHETNRYNTVPLNVSKLSIYSLFPGQVVVAKGNHVKTHALVAEELYSDTRLELPTEPPFTTSGLQIVVAAGPFTLNENRSYEPLHDLLKYVAEWEPHVLVLMGPFMDENNYCIQTGDMTQTFDSFFQELIDSIMNSIQHLDVQVVMIPSQKDIHHHPVYPTPPYLIVEQHKNLTIVSDPGVIEIDGLRIMATTADVLADMSKYELYYNRESVIKSGKTERLVSHILNQKNIYPLYPPSEDKFIDYVLLEQYGILQCKPHILILPSILKSFIKDIKDCLVINPERLTLGDQAGTFARIEIEPGNTRSICSRSAVQVLRV